MDPVWWWLSAGVILFIIEIFTPGFFSASMGIGAFITAIPAYLGTSLEVQLLVFALTSVISIFVLRPIIKKYFYEGADVRTNADALIGRTGTVVSPIDMATNQGRLRIDGDEWQFMLAQGAPQPTIGDTCRVLSRDSIILVVEPLKS